MSNETTSQDLTDSISWAKNGQGTGGSPNIRTMQTLVRKVNEAHGWFDSERTFGDDMALLHSEVSEAFEAFRKHGTDSTDHVSKQLCAAPHGLDDGHICKPEGVGSELADVLVRLLDTCSRYDIDIVEEFWRKLEYNNTRAYRHGNRRV